MKDFVHLHVHSAYSLLDGMITVPRLVQRARDLGMPALAITDHGNMFGVLEFYLECRKKKDKKTGRTLTPVKPIIGCEVYVAPKSRLIKEKQADTDENYHHLLLLAKDRTGYQNLLDIVSDASLNGFYYKPRTDKEYLQGRTQGLIALSACLGGEIPGHIRKNDVIAAENTCLEYQKLFNGDFFLEIQHNGLEEQLRVNNGLASISRKLGIPLVATNDIHFLAADDHEAHTILMALQGRKTMTEIKAERTMKLPPEVWFKDGAAMAEAFASKYPEALENTKKIADMCNLELDLETLHFPRFEVPEGYTVESFFEEKVWEGLKERFGEVSKEVKERALFEIDVIKKMNYSAYFLIVWDFMRFSRENGIPVGPGRGSAAGSIVSFGLRITDIDPLKYNLLFERFLNPSRRSMPDIDSDFADDRRDEVVQYLKRKYGEKNVTQIATFGTMGARVAVRDVARVLEIPIGDADRIAKMVPEHLGFDEAFKENPELGKLEAASDQMRKLFAVARKLENISRHASKHAAGVLIADREMVHYTPLFLDKDGNIISQFDKDQVEKVGLLKMDLLGLKTLGVIRDCIQEVKRTDGTDIDIATIPHDDKKTYQLLQKGRTIGVFQMEAAGFTKTLLNLKPTVFEDIIALLALYRPGPLKSGMVDTYIRRKHRKEEVEYFDPRLKKILEETYGVIVYQEQVMQLAQVMSGFTLAEADTIRRAIGKKDEAAMNQELQRLIDGALKNGFSDATARRIVNAIKEFAEYGFNKSHSAAYAYVAFQTAWLKAHYPVEFMAAQITNEMGDQKKLIKNINEARALKIKVLPPDVNRSFDSFTVWRNPQTKDKEIYFCLTAIKGVGEKAVRAVVEEREKNGPYRDFLDFCLRVDLYAVNRKVLEGLVKSGAFDSVEDNRARLFENIQAVQDHAAMARRDRDSGQINLFGEKAGPVPFKYQEFTDWDSAVKLEHEKELLGFYVSSHPLAKYQDVLEHFMVNKTSELGDQSVDAKVRLLGLVTQMKEEMVKDRYPKTTFVLEDFDGFISVELWNDMAKKCRGLVRENMLAYVEGTSSVFGNTTRVSCTRFMPVENINEKAIAEIHIKVNLVGLEEEKFTGLKQELSENKGHASVFLHFVEPMTGDMETETRVLRVYDKIRCSPTKKLKHYIANNFGEDAYWFDYHQEGK